MYLFTVKNHLSSETTILPMVTKSVSKYRNSQELGLTHFCLTLSVGVLLKGLSLDLVSLLVLQVLCLQYN